MEIMERSIAEVIEELKKIDLDMVMKMAKEELQNGREFDVHSLIAASVFRVPYVDFVHAKKLTSKRTLVKRALFAFMYTKKSGL
jgi:hypothetical protein